MNIACPQCSTVYRVDPARVPHGGVVARCRECAASLRVEPGESVAGALRTATLAQTGAAPAGGAPAARVPGGTPATTGSAPPSRAPAGGAVHAAGGGGRPQAPVFGPQDPDTRAKRLARALVSDIVVYNPDKWERARGDGSLRKAFRDEILKSWEEYVEQVGEPMAKRTPYFRDALNAILAEGKAVF